MVETFISAQRGALQNSAIPSRDDTPTSDTVQHQVDLLAKSVQAEQRHSGAMAASMTVMGHRIDALSEQVGVLRALLNASLNLPPAPMPGVQYPQPGLGGGGGVAIPWSPPRQQAYHNGDADLAHANRAMSRTLHSIVEALIGEGMPPAPEMGGPPWT